MTEMTDVQVEKITISAPVPLEFDRRLRIAVAERGVSSKADAIRLAVEDWLNAPPCPQCGRATGLHPDPVMVGVRYCFHCEEAVIFENGGQDVAE